MALPEGVTTCTIVAGVPVTHTGAAVKTYLSVEPSVFLVHTATGTPLVDFLEELEIGEGVAGQLSLPHTDQAGFQDENGNAYTNWYYTARISYSTPSKAKTKAPKIKVFQLVAGQTIVDLDALPGGAPALPYTAPIANVTAFNGRTGPVTVTDADLPERLSDTSLSATYATPATVTTAVAPKLDKTEAAASYAKLGTQKSRRPIDPRSVLMPGAPFERVVASTDLPTITFSSANPVANAKVIPFFTGGKATGSPYFTPTAGEDWSQPVLNEGTTRAWANQTGAGQRGQHSPASVMFGFDGASITIKIHSWAGNWYRVKVDDQYVTDVNGVLAPSDQTIQYMTLTWSAAKRRRIRIDMRNVDIYSFHLGTTATTGDTMWALNPRGPKVFVMADSYAAGNNSAPLGYTGISSWVWTMSDALGWENTINGGKYGTGWPTRSAVDKTDSFQDRVAALISWAPDVVIWAGGHNDKNVAAATLTAAVDSTLAAARAGLPDALFIVTGPFAGQEPVDGTAFTSWLPTQQAIFAGTTNHRTVNIDTLSRGIFTGTGRAGTPGTGNGEKYLSADIVHPSQAGSDYLGQRMAQIIFEAMTKA